MAPFEYRKSTDEVQVVQLSSEILHANWRKKKAVIGDSAGFEVWTHFVGSGSGIEVKIKDKKGKVHATIQGNVYGDYFGGSIVVPEKAKEHLTFKATLKDHGLEKESGIMEIVPPFDFINMRWSQGQARRGDVVELSADVIDIPDGTQVEISIYEYDDDGAHDCITKFPVWVEGGKIESEWEYEYHEDTDDIPIEGEMDPYGRHYAHPEYFWIAVVWDAVFGENQESGLLRFMDWLEVQVLDENGERAEGLNYRIQTADGNALSGSFDGSSDVDEQEIPPGRASIEFEDDDPDSGSAGA